MVSKCRDAGFVMHHALFNVLRSQNKGHKITLSERPTTQAMAGKECDMHMTCWHTRMLWVLSKATNITLSAALRSLGDSQ